MNKKLPAKFVVTDCWLCEDISVAAYCVCLFVVFKLWGNVLFGLWVWSVETYCKQIFLFRFKKCNRMIKRNVFKTYPSFNNEEMLA